MADDVSDKPAGLFADEPSPGERLREARLAKKLDTKEIALMLHVDPWMLDALEHDEYGALGAPVFAKGHLRKYATVLGIEPDELMVAYYQRAGTRETPPLIAESILRVEAAQRPRFGWLLPVAAGMSLFALVVFASMLYFRPDSGPAPARAAPVAERESANTSTGEPRSTRLTLPGAQAPGPDAPPTQSLRLAPTPAPVAPTPAREPPAETVLAAAQTPAPPPPEPVRKAPAPVETAPVVAEPAAATDKVTLMLRFREESWVEVYDRERAKLLYGLGEPGSTQYLSGPPPLQVFLGKASGVEVQVDGGRFEIPRGTRRGNTARFVVEKPAP